MKKPTPPHFLFALADTNLQGEGVKDFVKELETFHFGEKSFQRNNSRGKFTEHCAAVKIHFEYSYLFNRDEEVFRRADNMMKRGKHFSKKRCTSGSKDDNTIIEMRLKKQRE